MTAMLKVPSPTIRGRCNRNVFTYSGMEAMSNPSYFVYRTELKRNIFRKWIFLFKIPRAAKSILRMGPICLLWLVGFHYLNVIWWYSIGYLNSNLSLVIISGLWEIPYCSQWHDKCRIWSDNTCVTKLNISPREPSFRQKKLTLYEIK